MSGVTFVVARADNGVIGRDNALPWHIPADLRHFKAKTLGTTMIMGRRTFDSLGRALPGRRHVVLTRDPGWGAPGVEVAGSPDAALALAGPGPVTVIGGAEVFAALLGSAERIELTEVHAAPEGETVMPPFDGWREIAREDHPAEGETPGFSFVTLVRPG